MYAEITSRNIDGTPNSVHTDDGFAQISRPYDESRDGWIEGQLDIEDFDAIKTGRQMEQLVNMVNSLRRQNFELKQELKMWKKSTGLFGA